MTDDNPTAPSSCRIVLWVVACALLSSVWCVTSARRLGATFDEPIYVTRGLERWRTGSTTGLMKLGTMPLPVDVQTLPLYLWEKWRGRPIDPETELHAVLPFARAATLLFWWLLLLHAYLAARSLAGPWAGAVAVTVLVCEPCLAAHAGLATTDVAVTACLIALCYHFRANRERGWGRRVAWPALWFGLAVLAKASGLVFGALCLVLIEAERCGWRLRRPLSVVRCPLQKPTDNGQRTNLSASLKDLFQIGALGMVLVFVYCGSDWQPQASLLAWARRLPPGRWSALMVWVAEHLRVFSNAGDGLMRQVTHNVRGHGSYLLGHSDPRALWYYFPVLLSIKTSLPLLLAPLVLAAVNCRARGGRWYGNWALLCTLGLLLFSVVCRVQIGIRFMLPLVALAAVGSAAVLVRTVQNTQTVWLRRGLLGAAAAGLLWTAGDALAVWPNGLCYVNPLWGGTRDGYQLVSEANYDWGQGLKELARWQRRHRQADLCVWYFGTDPLVRRLPIRSLLLHTLPLKTPADVLRQVRGCHLAVSTSLLYGNIPVPAIAAVRRVLAKRRPVARTCTFLIYDFTAD